MPHTTIEHSFKITEAQAADLLLQINQNIAKNEGNFDITQCKARTLFCQNFVIGDDVLEQDFAHITIKIMTGRSLEIRKSLAKNILKIVSDFFKENNLSKNPIALSVDVAELEREIYQKTVINM